MKTLTVKQVLKALDNNLPDTRPVPVNFDDGENFWDVKAIKVEGAVVLLYSSDDPLYASSSKEKDTITTKHLKNALLKVAKKGARGKAMFVDRVIGEKYPIQQVQFVGPEDSPYKHGTILLG